MLCKEFLGANVLDQMCPILINNALGSVRSIFRMLEKDYTSLLCYFQFEFPNEI